MYKSLEMNTIQVFVYFYLTLQGIFMDTLLPIPGPCVWNVIQLIRQIYSIKVVIQIGFAYACYGHEKKVWTFLVLCWSYKLTCIML